MGSKSQAIDQTSTSTTNLALSRDAITESGTQILDSIIVDPSDEALKAMVGSLEADFRVLVSGQTANLQGIVELGQKVLDLADRGQVQMAGVAQNTLRASLDWMKEQVELGKYVVDFTQRSVDKSYDLAGRAIANNNDALARALDITADVKTGDFAATLKSITTIIAVFALGAIYLSRGK